MKNLDMTKGSILKNIILFSIPLIIGNLFQQFYNMVDTAILGKFAGTNDLAAVGSTGGVCFFLNTLIIGVSSGCSIIVAQTFGEKNEHELKSCIFNATVFCLACGLLTSILGFVFIEDILIFLKTPQELLAGANEYMRYTLIGMTVVAGYNLISAILRGIGESKVPFYILIVCSLINVVLDLIFVIVFGWGIMGVALATLIAQTFSCVIGVFILLKKFPIVKLKKEEMKLNRGMAKKIFSLAIPTTLQMSLTAIGFITMQVGVNGLGATVVAAYTAGNKLDQLFTTCFNSFGQVAATFVAQNKGASQYTRIKEGVSKLMKFTAILAVIVTLVIWFGGKYLLLIFLHDSETEVIKIALEYMRIVSLFFIPLAWMHLYSNILRAMNKPLIPLAGGIFEFVARVSCTFLAVYVLRERMVIWISAPVAWILTDPALIIRYYILMKRELKQDRSFSHIK